MPQEIIQKNRDWAKKTREQDPQLFDLLKEEQNPDVLWIGCSDSRAAPEIITNSPLGSLFVHRNIAALVQRDDLTLLSIAEFALAHLKVKEVIICGHYGCGGIRAAMQGDHLDFISDWLSPVDHLYQKSQSDLAQATTAKEKEERFIEEVIKHQVNQFSLLSITTKERNNRDKVLPIHGYVYSLETGLLTHLCTNTSSLKGS